MNLKFFCCVGEKKQNEDFPGSQMVDARDRVRSLVQEDPTRWGATKPVRHNYWAHASHLQSSLHSLQLEKARKQQRRPSTARST